MNTFDADLHLHSPHAGGVSDKMQIPVMAEQGDIKGLDLIGTGDILCPPWQDHVREHTTETGDGIYTADNGQSFLLTCEVEDQDRIHHVLLFPSMGATEDLHDELGQYSTDITYEGRPRIEASGETIAQACERHGVLIGPAHAFTPWTAIYKEYDSLQGCYGNTVDSLAFLELGLSADSTMADRISAHHDLSLVSFSDAHSPWPHRLGREFTRFRMQDIGFAELGRALRQRNGRGIALNAGFDPREGKYHCTACLECGQAYTLQQAQDFEWSCQDCGNRIKKGVKDRIAELSDTDSAPDRPPYMHLVPLAEIIQHVVGHASPTTKTVQSIYDEFQAAFASEIEMLTEAPITELNDVHPRVGAAIRLFREEKTLMKPGGGGSYGELIIPDSEEHRERILEQQKHAFACEYVNTQSGLNEF